MYTFHTIPNIPETHHNSDLCLFPFFQYLNPEIFRLVAMISSAYVAHYNAPKFWNELKDRTRTKYNTVVASSFFISFIIYVIVATAGFYTFGGHSSGFILNNYANSDVLATIARVAIGLGVYVCSSIYIYSYIV